MRALASFAMRSRINAILSVCLFALLGMILTPLAMVGGGVVALATLRHGPREGLLVALAAALTVAVATHFWLGSAAMGLAYLLAFWLPVWGIAVVLRNTVSLSWAVLATALMAAVVLALLYGVAGEPQAFWTGMIDNFVSQLGDEVPTGSRDLVTAVASAMHGVIAASLAASVLMSLVLGRWWQSVLYNPGGFRDEYHALRMPQWMAAVAALVFVSVWLTGTGVGSFPGDLALVLFLVYAMQGTAVVHGTVGRTPGGTGWVVGMYVLAFILPQMVVLLAVLGLVDSRLDIRTRYRERAKGGDGNDRND